MSQLAIADLNFLEPSLPENSQIKGGLSTALATDLDTSFSIKGSPLGGNLIVRGSGAGAAAGAVSVFGQATAVANADAG